MSNELLSPHDAYAAPFSDAMPLPRPRLRRRLLGGWIFATGSLWFVGAIVAYLVLRVALRSDKSFDMNPVLAALLFYWIFFGVFFGSWLVMAAGAIMWLVGTVRRA